MNIFITDNYNDEQEFSYRPVTVILECDEEGALIKYSLDGKDPFRFGLKYKGPFIIPEYPTRDITLKAIAYKDGAVGPVFMRQYSLIDPLGDEDKDGLTNIEEGLSDNQDSDADGIPDYLDEDSNDDGIPDSVQLRTDVDKDGIPDRIQVRNNEFKIVVESDFDGQTEIVENYPYNVIIKCISGSGVVDIRNDGVPLDRLSSFICALGPELPVFMEANTEVNYLIMISQCRHKDKVLLQYTAYDANTSGLDSGTICDADIVMETDELPYVGMRISWSTEPDAVSYIIQKNDDPFFLEVPAVDYKKVDMQWYLDREGTLEDKYSVAYKNAKGKIGPYSLPRHAPDIHEGKCLLQGNIASVGLNPVKGIPIAYRVVSVGKNNLVGNTIVVKSTYFTYTDSDGSFEMVVPQNAILKIKVDEAGYDRNFAIPCSKSADLRYLDAMPNNNL